MRVSLSKITKFFLMVYFMYVYWFVNGVMESRLLLHGVTLLATACPVYEAIQKKKFYLPQNPFLKMLFLYGIYAAFSGFLLARSKSLLLSQLFSYFAVAVVLYDCWYVSRKEGSMEWLGRTVTAAAVISACQLILFPYEEPLEGRFSLGPTSNPNILGVIMVMGLFFLLHKKEKIEQHFFLKMVTVLILLYAIIMTGSRKSLVAGMIVVLIWFISFLKTQIHAKMQVRTFIVTLFLVIGVTAAAGYMAKSFVETAIYDRFVQLVENHGSASRSNLYKEAVDVWIQHPLFGVGYAQFSLYSSMAHISHSTYMEILSCTGAVGFLIVFIPVGKMGKQLFRNAFARGRRKDRYEDQMLLAIFLVELFLGIGQEWLYYSINLVCLFYLSWQVEREVIPMRKRPVLLYNRRLEEY